MRRCHHCGYSREGIALDRPCPECGTVPPIALARIAGRSVRAWWLVPTVLAGSALALDLLVGLLIPLLSALTGSHGVADGGNLRGAPPLCCCATSPLVLLVGLVGYLFRFGPREEWGIEDDRLVVREAASGTVLRAWPLETVEALPRWSSSPIGRTLVVRLRGRGRVERTIAAELPMEDLLATRDEIQARCERAFAEGVGRRLPATFEPAVAVRWALAPTAMVRCAFCGQTRPLDRRHEACDCGAPGWPGDLRAFPVGSHRRVGPATAADAGLGRAFLRLRGQLGTLPSSPLVVGGAVLAAFVIGGLVTADREWTTGTGALTLLLVSFPLAGFFLLLLAPIADGTTAALVVGPRGVELLTAAGPIAVDAASLAGPLHPITVVRTAQGMIALRLSRAARRDLAAALTPTRSSPAASS